ncbi:MAG: septum site-determining protein MinC [Chloroflexota bacterium]|nr:septum site-determining protein MinC [Chloroflexota bacterium]
MATISFKGTREGLLITLGEGAWHEVLNELAVQLSRPSAQSFFKGARVILETGARPIAVTELEELIALFAQHEMTLTSVMGERQAQEALDQLQASMPPPESLTRGNIEGQAGLPADATQALLIRRTVRSGQVIRHAGTVVVIGDVNPGAEVIAEGDVIVWGKLRGVVHAGASGNESAVVGALILTPTQLRIGGYIARAPDDKRTSNWLAEIARVRDGQIVVEPWSA